jgi:hypothetical protein
MLFKQRGFNHDHEIFHKALNITDETKTVVREKIFFSSFSNALQAMDLFENIEDAPRSLSTVTGDLEKCLMIIETQEEYEYALLSFSMYQRLTKPILAEYRMKNSSDSEDREAMLKHTIIEAIMELKRQKDREESEDEDDIDNEEETGPFAVNHSRMMTRLKYVKKSNYNFAKYMNMMQGNKDTKSDFDIEGLLGNILNGDDD